MKRFISVVIPTYQRPRLLERCLQALMRQRFPANQFEVIVVDDGADPETRRVVDGAARQSAVPFTYLAQTERRGPAAARNRGWRAANGTVIAFTDDDCIPDEDWLAVAAKDFLNGAKAVSGQVRVPRHDPPTEAEKTVALLETAEFVTANCFCRRSVLEQIGGLDERFDIAWREDSDLQFRLLKLGVTIVKNRNAIIVHPCRTSPWWASLKDERRNAYDALLYKQHTRLFRDRIPMYRRLVTLYYIFVFSFLLGILCWLSYHQQASAICLIIWTICLSALIQRRLRGTAWSVRQIGQTLLKALLTPFLSVYWRLYGAVKYRTLFW
ncbi:glycosyltransferase family 2 protein [Larkinella terrae]|uniref:Glycosyltransferase n=1 Tax=Larkinella terrae TaxID=2025311 RepID=A0A7K0ECL0_9BACT|nr:glycosyltransferase [Larkinella terrae]MRS59700.1 glycosyltransferase [Larkinella terrae]